MARTKEGSVTREAKPNTGLKSYVDRLEALEEERKAIGQDIKDVLDEAAKHEYDPKVLRKVIQVRKLERALYEAAEEKLRAYLEELS